MFVAVVLFSAPSSARLALLCPIDSLSSLVRYAGPLTPDLRRIFKVLEAGWTVGGLVPEQDVCEQG